MVFLLVGDILSHGVAILPAHGKNPVSFLPTEGRVVMARGPYRRRFLYFSHEIRRGGGGGQSNQKMHVIFNPAGDLRDRSQSADGTAEVLVETRTPIRFYQRPAVLGADDDMMM